MGRLYILCKALPFGLRSAPKLVTAVADGLSWALQCEGVVNSLHYLDDFFFWSEANSPNCACALSTAVLLCLKLGLPVAAQKVVGPATTIVFLSILIDSAGQEVRLPDDKLVWLRQELRSWGDKRAATKRQLQSLIGLLSHVAKVVRPGRPFLRSLIDAMMIPQRQNQKVRLNLQCRGDIVWWQEFLLAWNGVGFFPGGPLRATLYSDASGQWGCGAFVLGSAEWLQQKSQDPSPRPRGGLDVQELDGEARVLLVQGLSASSRYTYGAGKRRYLSFCARANLNPLPASEATLCHFVAHLATEGLRAQSISGYLAAVRHLSIEAGFAPLPRGECPRLAYVLKGVSRSQVAAPKPRRLPITPHILLSLKDAWERETIDAYSAWLFWAISLTAFFGCFRIGELTRTDLFTCPAVEVGDVSFEGDPVRARIHLWFSKTDTSGAGADNILGSTGDPLCPVTALGNYLQTRPAGPGALFVSAGGSPVSRAFFVTAVSTALLAAGVSSNGILAIASG
uniref:Reverse transcriptase domain-containing protein n=1 Tax=Amphimedon queenslandica TaxID=400682 RepID=A0A1X7UFL3_AMPQE